MKLITLNIWGGHVHAPLLNFVSSCQDVDIFCLQEVYHQAPHMITEETRKVHLDIFSQLQALLPEHQGFFRPVVENIYGIGMFVRRTIDVRQEGELTIYENPIYPGRGPTHSRNLQWLQFLEEGQMHTIVNVHGLWNGKGKTDSPERIAQSQNIKKFIDALSTPKILCGDFNLRPDTESVKILEQGMDNLIQRYGVSSTRTSFYPKEEKFADYIFTSPEVNVRSFEVLNDEVSDHAPLLLDFT